VSRRSAEGSGALLLLTVLLSGLAIVGKVAAGWAAPWERFRRLVVGVGMVPRGEVGLIFANIGLRSGVINEAVFSALLLVVMVTTFVAPPALKALFSRENPDAAT
jgi:Kef-type K+ transport system membrane component KefB